MSSLFRGKFLSMLKEADLVFSKEMSCLKDKVNFNKFLNFLQKVP